MEVILNEFYKNPLLDKDLTEVDFWGGRARGASHTATFFFLMMLIGNNYFRGYMMRFIYSDIRGSLWRDLLDRMKELNIPENKFQINESTMTITYMPNGNTIFSKGFRKSAGTSTAKLKSIAGATHVLIEECEEIPENDYLKLKDSLRTKKSNLKIIRLWNPPPKNHWLIRNYFNLQPTAYPEYFSATPKGLVNHCAVYSTYKDNIANLNEEAIRRYEAYEQTNIEHYLTDVIGLIPSGAKGRVYKNFEIYESLPNTDYFTIFGLDFGYSNDPSVLVELNFVYKKRIVYIKEHFRQKGLSIRSIVDLIRTVNIKNHEVICDSAEPREIDELSMHGINALRADKPGGSIERGISIVKAFELFIDVNSTGLIDELNSYKYSLDMNGDPTNKPEDMNNHGLDALRYAAMYYNKNYGYEL